MPPKLICDDAPSPLYWHVKSTFSLIDPDQGNKRQGAQLSVARIGGLLCGLHKPPEVSMRKTLTWIGAAALIVGLAAPAARVAMAAEEDCCTVEHMITIEHMVMDAKTAADHQAIASRYETSAKALEAQAETHARLAKQYKTLHTVKGANPADHCQRLAANFRTSAQLNRELAETHRELAHTLK